MRFILRMTFGDNPNRFLNELFLIRSLFFNEHLTTYNSKLVSGYWNKTFQDLVDSDRFLSRILWSKSWKSAEFYIHLCITSTFTQTNATDLLKKKRMIYLQRKKEVELGIHCSRWLNRQLVRTQASSWTLKNI